LGEAGADVCQLGEGIAAVAAYAVEAGELALEVAQCPQAGSAFLQVIERAAEEIVHFRLRVIRL
jgi:hypothetical protein